jgi:hypothetical protein
MALQNKTTTPNTAPKTQKFTTEELDKIKSLQSHMNKLTISFGQLYLSKAKIEEQEKNLKNHLISIEKEESNLATSLTEKYGKGTLDIETGTFTSIE